MLINCDLGEWETPEQTREFMTLIGAANISCGGHAGNENSMRYCLELCQELAVRPGAHPGLSVNKGRGEQLPSRHEFIELLKRQVGELLEISQSLHHVKLHGSLYHAVETHEDLAELYAIFLEDLDLSVFCLAGGSFINLAQSGGLTVFAEAFVDRGYQDNGQLIPRDEDGAILSNINEITQQMSKWKETSFASTFCVHSDSPNALAIIEHLSSL